MKRASHHFTSEQRQAVSKAVSDAESSTAAEIVPVVATASGRYDRAEDMAGLTLAIFAFITAWALFQRDDPTAGGWDGMEIALDLPLLIAILVAGFIIGAVIATRVAWLRRLFTPRAQMRDEVAARARQIFFDRRVRRTQSGGGLLIYISLHERLAVLLADEAVQEKLGQRALGELCASLTAELGRASVAEALGGAIHAAGRRLASAMPREGGDRNELPDALVLID